MPPIGEKMKYCSTTLATNFTHEEMNHWKVLLIKALLWFIPRSNPDNEPLYPQVKKWLLELNEANEPVREIGLDIYDQPLFCAPNERNFGFWTDSNEPIENDYIKTIEKDFFDKLWSQINKK